MNRSQLLNKFAEVNELTRKEADAVLTSLVDIITGTVAAGEDVAISGFAKFRRIDRPARLARNPATGETVKVKAKRVARITPLKNFKDSVLSGKAPRPAAKKAAKARQEGPRQEGSGEEGPGQEEGRREEDREEGTGAQARQAPLTEASTALRRPGPSARAFSRPVRSARVVRSASCRPRPRRRDPPHAAPAARAVPHRAQHDDPEGCAPRTRRDRRRRRVGRGRCGDGARRTRPRRSTPRASCSATSSCRALFAGAAVDDVRGHHAARAALSGAILDARPARRRRLARVVSRRHRAPQVDAGVADRPTSTTSPSSSRVVAAYVELGYRSVKLKIAPGPRHRRTWPRCAPRSGPPSRSRSTPTGATHSPTRSASRRLDALDVACFEQPLAPDALLEHARLAAAAAHADRSRRDDHERRGSRVTRSSSVRARSSASRRGSWAASTKRAHTHDGVRRRGRRRACGRHARDGRGPRRAARARVATRLHGHRRPVGVEPLLRARRDRAVRARRRPADRPDRARTRCRAAARRARAVHDRAGAAAP